MVERVALITCEFWFEASHVLAREDWSEEQNDRVFGPCARLHGHSYHLKVTLRGAPRGGAWLYSEIWPQIATRAYRASRRCTAAETSPPTLSK